ncbi:MAG: hypothetical protein D6732_17030 [Methanobacteriota archaeon]|nr:MAG: hypothetical protein D6732_17030 [Euryarchaeota archaeon]
MVNDFQQLNLNNIEQEPTLLQNNKISSQAITTFSSSPFFSPHQYGGVDNDFSNDKAFFLTKEGTFFPKKSYSKLAFFTPRADFIKARILAVNEVTGRVLRVYQGSDPNNLELEYQTIVRPNQENFVSINFNTPLTNLYVVFEIYFGNYAERAWMLEWVYFKNDTRSNYQQFFPLDYRSKIETQFIGGEATLLSFDLEQYLDTYDRLVSVYVDGILKIPETKTINGKMSISSFYLGNYIERSIHNLTIQIRSGSYMEFGWALKSLRINYLGAYVEIDQMEGYSVSTDIFDYIEDYFETNGYERINIFLSDTSLPVIERTSAANLRNYYETYSLKNTLTKHRYVLLGKYADSSGALGFVPVSKDTDNYYIANYAFIAIQEIKDLRKLPSGWKWFFYSNDKENIMSTIMHELGHTLGIVKIRNGGEYYEWGNRDDSVMNTLNLDNSRPYPYYSQFWWTGDGRWWDLRTQFDATTVVKPIGEVEV